MPSIYEVPASSLTRFFFTGMTFSIAFLPPQLPQYFYYLDYFYVLHHRNLIILFCYKNFIFTFFLLLENFFLYIRWWNFLLNLSKFICENEVTRSRVKYIFKNLKLEINGIKSNVYLQNLKLDRSIIMFFMNTI